VTDFHLNAPKELLAYDSLIASRKLWADYRFPRDSPEEVPLSNDTSARKYLRYLKWMEHGYRPTRKAQALFDQWLRRYKLGWRLNIWGREDPHHWGNVDRAMSNIYRMRKYWKVANSSTGHLFAWRMKQKAKRNWPK
jgi:hypothetical protein